MKRHRSKPVALKAWGGRRESHPWQRKLSQTLTVSRVDENIPVEKQTRLRKPWFIALTQKPNLLTTAGGVLHLPAGDTLLLSEDDVVALVGYLLEPQTALWCENPSPTEPGEYEFSAYLQPGMVGLTESGDVCNGEAQWSPAYFSRQKAYDLTDGLRTRKVHTLPWKLQLTEGLARARRTAAKRPARSRRA
jgi:hypothetical protein